MLTLSAELSTREALQTAQRNYRPTPGVAVRCRMGELDNVKRLQQRQACFEQSALDAKCANARAAQTSDYPDYNDAVAITV